MSVLIVRQIAAGIIEDLCAALDELAAIQGDLWSATLDQDEALTPVAD